MTEVLARYHEIALKGKNRPFFVDKLAQNLRRACADLGAVKVRSLPGRLSVLLPDDVPWAQARDRLASVFGVANFSRVLDAPRDMEALERAAVRAVRGRSFASFRVTTRRSDKTFPLNSGEIDRFYFRSLYFREPNGILFEIATDGPGFATDEPMATLGEKLALPPFLEARRAEIEKGLKAIG